MMRFVERGSRQLSVSNMRQPFLFLTAVESTIQIIGLISPESHHRIIDPGAGNLQPCAHVFVGKKAVGVRIGDPGDLFRSGNRFFRGGFRRSSCNGLRFEEGTVSAGDSVGLKASRDSSMCRSSM